MVYKKIISGIFISRPNRFIAHVEINGKEEIVHVKNTGRCKELLIPGVTVYLEDFEGRMGSRKLRYSLIAVEKYSKTGTDCDQNNFRKDCETILMRELCFCDSKTGADCDRINSRKDREAILINIDSQAPNKVVGEWISTQGYNFLKPEYTFGKSRIDFYMEKGSEKFLLEVKGCTLEFDGHCLFPDAPTERGVKHIEELIKAKEQGYNSAILILIQMENVKDFAPNDETHKAFGDALRLANKKGVKILCYNCKVTPNTLTIGSKVPVIL